MLTLIPGEATLAQLETIWREGAPARLDPRAHPAIAAFRAAGCAMALATDCNPGSAPISSLLLAMNMGATLFRMTPDECLRGVTAQGARALGLADAGRLAPGLRADLAVWDIEDPAELTYRIGFNPLHCRYFEGTKC